MNPTPQDIDAYLAAIEHEHDIQIIGAWNTGSQAWGLDSEASDWDISIIYTQPLTNYATNSTYYEKSIRGDGDDLSPESIPDATDLPREDIEYEGWDTRRFLELAAENNPSILEALNTPEAYRLHPILDQIRDYLNQHFNAIELHNHYQSLAKSTYHRFITSCEERTIKRNLLIIRACLYDEYILETHEFPHLDFERFLDEQCPESILQSWDEDTIRMLIEEKRDAEGDKEIGNPLGDRIEETIAHEIEHRDHLREAHAFTDAEAERYGGHQHDDIPLDDFPPEGHTCWPPHCSGHTDGGQLDHYMRRLLQSRTLFQ